MEVELEGKSVERKGYARRARKCVGTNERRGKKHVLSTDEENLIDIVVLDGAIFAASGSGGWPSTATQGP